jgi:HEAT repeat protein
MTSDPDALERLTALLVPDYGPDGWSDEAKPRAGGELRALGDADWPRLEEAARSRPAGWRTRLAEALLLTEDPAAVGLLIELIRADDAAVAAAAADTLVRKSYQWDPQVALRADLERHMERADPQQREALERLAVRLLR